jgi:hypothetical protein
MEVGAPPKYAQVSTQFDHTWDWSLATRINTCNYSSTKKTNQISFKSHPSLDTSYLSTSLHKTWWRLLLRVWWKNSRSSNSTKSWRWKNCESQKLLKKEMEIAICATAATVLSILYWLGSPVSWLDHQLTSKSNSAQYRILFSLKGLIVRRLVETSILHT